MKKIIADRAYKIDASGIRKVFALAASMKNPVNFSIGQPDFDVPEELKSTSAPPKENEYDTDNNWHERWEWVLNEMIWAFEQKARDGGWEGDYYDFEDDPDGLFGLKMTRNDDEGRKAHQERMSNGFRLFGKYYEALWD